MYYLESIVFFQPYLLFGPPVRRRQLSVGGKVLGVEEFAVVDVGLPFKMSLRSRMQKTCPRLREFRIHEICDKILISFISVYLCVQEVEDVTISR